MDPPQLLYVLVGSLTTIPEEYKDKRFTVPWACGGTLPSYCSVVVKHPNKGNLRVEGFIWAIGTSPSWWQQPEAVGHHALAVRKQREMNAIITQLTFIQARTGP